MNPDRNGKRFRTSAEPEEPDPDCLPQEKLNPVARFPGLCYKQNRRFPDTDHSEKQTH